MTRNMSDMNNILTKLFMVIMLMMFSMGAQADVKVLFGEDGKELQPGKDGTITLPQKEVTGGTIIITQVDQKDGTTIVTFKVTPDKGYTMTEAGPEVYAVISPNGATTRTPEVSTKINLKSDDFTDISQKRTYTTTIDSKLALWVKSADFQLNDSKVLVTGTISEGVYYIANSDGYSNTTANNWYLVPADNPQQKPKNTDAYYSPNYNSTNGDPAKPYLTTYKTNKDAATVPPGVTERVDNSIWIIKASNVSGYFNIIHAATGKYVIYEVPLPNDPNTNSEASEGSNGKRKTMHLQTIDDTDYNPSTNDNFNFIITETSSNSGKYTIQPKNRTGWYWNPANGNKTTYYGQNSSIYQGGLIGVFNSSSEANNWRFDTALAHAPSINYDPSTGTYKITTSLEGSYDIRYTIDGSTPNINSPVYDGTTINVTEAHTVKAIVTAFGMVLTEMATQAVQPLVTPPDPEITVSDQCSNEITITAEGATIYYTTDDSEPSKTNGTLYNGPFALNNNATINAVSYYGSIRSDGIVSIPYTANTLPPTITVNGDEITISGSGSIYYNRDDANDPTTSSTPYTGTITLPTGSGIVVIKAIAKEEGKNVSCVSEKSVRLAIFISDVDGLNSIQADDNCVITAGFDASGYTGNISNFTGTFDGGLYTITGLKKPLFNSVSGGTVKNVILKDVEISGGTNAGAICNEATGDSRIYNCGVLGTLTEAKDEYGKVTSISSTSTVSGSGYVGSIVGLLDGTSRVINCYSFAKVSGGSVNAGIVGYNNQSSTQDNLKTVVVNCMFYGDITGSGYPVYGGYSINNDVNNGINPYCYFRKNTTFTVTGYNRSWPAEEKNLTRFEYYRSVLNSNRKLCTWWVSGTNETAPTDDDISDVGIAKWVLDPSIAPYPILKTWGKYPSIINPDPTQVWDPRTEDANGNPVTPHWVERSSANAWEGKSYNTLSVTIKAGLHNSGASDVTKDITITDMDTLNCDYGYYKIQLPYYNEVFGNPNGATHAAKYAGNYTDYVVTGWDISGGSAATDYNFADRNSYKDRVYAQGGYFYVPEGVSSISITAHWGKAVYLANRGYSIDRVKVTAEDYKADKAFASAGTVPNTFQGQTVYDDLQNAIKALGTNSDYPTVYDQAIVLIGNHQVKNGSNKDNSFKDLDVSYALDGKWHPFSIMSADLDFDNEPDNCLQLQFRRDIDRPGIQPIRFDFLPVIELGLAVRHDNKAYSIGIMVPQGHFEVTETAFMRTTQFEYDGFTKTSSSARIEDKSPVILNGGEFEMFTVRYHNSDRTSYFLLGGNVWVHRFAPGAHPNKGNSPSIYLCPIIVIGGQVKELYLTGLYRPELSAPSNQGAPRCYMDGGKFDIVAGAGYDKVEAGANVTFKINHSKIDEFYGGGINGSNPISGDIYVTINNSCVDKYCGGPKVGDMTGHTVNTKATGTTFGVFYGGGNGGNSYYRQLQKDGDEPSTHIGTWNDNDYNWDGFTPLATNYDDNSEAGQTGKDKKNENKGYHAEYEFEVFNQSNGVSEYITQRGFIRWIQFGITKTGNVSNTLNDCTIENNFYGGGNLATVDGTVTSTLTNTTVKGNVFGAGYSADIPTFQVHDKDTKVFPSITAGVITDGHIDNDVKVYKWTNDLDGEEGHDEAYMKAHPTYSKMEDGVEKWYCYTWNSLDDLGAVKNQVTLTITTSGSGESVIGTVGDTTTGHVYGGGDASAVKNNTTPANASTTVNISGKTLVRGNVFGGGNKGVVSGSATVNIE